MRLIKQSLTSRQTCLFAPWSLPHFPVHRISVADRSQESPPRLVPVSHGKWVHCYSTTGPFYGGKVKKQISITSPHQIFGASGSQLKTRRGFSGGESHVLVWTRPCTAGRGWPSDVAGHYVSFGCARADRTQTLTRARVGGFVPATLRHRVTRVSGSCRASSSTRPIPRRLSSL